MCFVKYIGVIFLNIEEAKNHLLEVLPKFDAKTQSAIKIIMSKAECNRLQIFDENIVEEWRNIEGYESAYQVSNVGRVRSFKSGQWKILKPTYVKGYLQIGLSRNSKCHKYALHILVAKAFIPNPQNKSLVHHKDNNPMNCQKNNLEWATPSENTQHAFDNNFTRVNRGTNHYNSKLNKEDVLYIRKNYIPYDKKFGMSALSRKFHLNLGTIMEIIQGKSYKDIKEN